MNTNNGNTLFPVFLKAEELHTLVIGGGKVALEKLQALTANAPEARITLVAPDILEDITALARNPGTITLLREPYRPEHLRDKDIVIVATGNRELNEGIHADARRRRVLINVTDTPGLCDFYLGSVVKKGNLKIAISTNGKSPTLAKRLREYFEKYIPDEIGGMMDNLNAIRERIRGDFSRKVKVLNRLTDIFRMDESEVIKN